MDDAERTQLDDDDPALKTRADDGSNRTYMDFEEPTPAVDEDDPEATTMGPMTARLMAEELAKTDPEATTMGPLTDRVKRSDVTGADPEATLMDPPGGPLERLEAGPVADPGATIMDPPTDAMKRSEVADAIPEPTPHPKPAAPALPELTLRAQLAERDQRIEDLEVLIAGMRAHTRESAKSAEADVRVLEQDLAEAAADARRSHQLVAAMEERVKTLRGRVETLTIVLAVVTVLAVATHLMR